MYLGFRFFRYTICIFSAKKVVTHSNFIIEIEKSLCKTVNKRKNINKSCSGLKFDVSFLKRCTLENFSL